MGLNNAGDIMGNNFYEIYNLIKETEGAIEKAIDKYTVKAIKFFGLDDSDDIRKMLKVVYLLDPTPNKINLSKMTKLTVDSNSNKFIKNLIYLRAYSKFIKSNIAEYSIKVRKVNSFSTMEELKTWMLGSMRLVKQRKKERESKGADYSDSKILIFGDDLFDAYLITNPETASDIYGGFATWCWTKEPKYWKSYSSAGLIFVLENKSIDNFVKKSPPDIGTQEKYIACSLKINSRDGTYRFGEINHLNNSTSKYENYIEKNIDNFVEAFEEKMGIDISEFESIYDPSDRMSEESGIKSILNNISNDYEILGDEIIINSNSIIINDGTISYDEQEDFEELNWGYPITFFGQNIYVDFQSFSVNEAPKLSEVCVDQEGSLHIGKSDYIESVEVNEYCTLSLGDVKEIKELNFNGGYIDIEAGTKIKEINMGNNGCDITELKLDGKGRTRMDIGGDSVAIDTEEGVELELTWGKGTIVINDYSKGLYILIPDNDSLFRGEIEIHSKNFKELISTFSMAYEGKIECDGTVDLENLVKDGKLILLDDVSGDMQPYEYDKSHFKNGKFVFWGELGLRTEVRTNTRPQY